MRAVVDSEDSISQVGLLCIESFKSLTGMISRSLSSESHNNAAKGEENSGRRWRKFLQTLY